MPYTGHLESAAEPTRHANTAEDATRRSAPPHDHTLYPTHPAPHTTIPSSPPPPGVGVRELKLPWRKAGPPNHLDDKASPGMGVERVMCNLHVVYWDTSLIRNSPLLGPS